LYNQIYKPPLMPATTRSRNLYQKFARVFVNLVRVSCTQKNTDLLQHRNCPAHDVNHATW